MVLGTTFLTMKDKRVTAIIAAGGLGKRLGLKTAKPFIKIAGKPLLIYSLDIFEKSNFIDAIVLVVAKNFLKKTKRLIRKKAYKKLKTVVAGGSSRARSVYNGLCVTDSNSAIVLVHDAARPFLKQSLVKRCVTLTRRGVNCIAAVPTKATVKEIDFKNRYIHATPERKTLWEAQTPQVFDKRILLKAYSKLGKMAWKFKDDASLVETYGAKVKVLEGDYSNIKITTKEDLKIAEALYNYRG